MKIFSERRNKKGFTITEIMMTVAILIVAMALAIPGIIGISKNLEITRLDDIAREIYTAAQSRAVSLSVSGQLSQLKSVDVEVENEESSAVYKYVYKSGVTPSDAAVTDWDMLLPLGSIDENVRPNYYIIEYYPVTAIIKGVYYWEDEGNDFYINGYSEEASKDRDYRMKYDDGMVGYYGGTDVDEDRLVYTGSVKAELINDEELFLKIMQRKDGDKVLDGAFTVTLTDLDKNKSMEIASFNNDSVEINIAYNLVKESSGGVTYFKLTLDSLKSDLRFSKIMERLKGPNGILDDSFHPGCNLRVTVSFQRGNEIQEESFLTNSLFDSVKGEIGERTALISCGRHLENLGLPWAYPDGHYNKNDDLSGVKYAEQTEDIDWHESLKALMPTGPNVLSILPELSFKPITNEHLERFNGRGNIISHMDIYGDANGVLSASPNGVGIGLFSSFEGDSLTNVNLVDCTVKKLENGKNPHVGLLAGIISNKTNGNCEVTNCHAYATVTVKKENRNVKSCSIEAAGANSVGGLFGYIQNENAATIKQCSASLTEITGGNYVGGLAGRVDCESAKVTSCYANTGVCNSERTGWQSGMSGSNVGGLLGSIDKISGFTMENSYAVGYVSDNGKSAYGLVGSGSGTCTIRNCYAALMKDNDFVKKLVPASLDSPPAISNCLNYNGTYKGFDSLMGPGGEYVRADAKTTNPYGLYEPKTSSENNENTAAYPFPRLKGMSHYGDWPREGLGVLMAYYEVYKDKSGNYSIGFFNEDLFKYDKNYDLKNDKEHTVVMDGYAVMLPVEVKEKRAQYGTIDVETGLLNKDKDKGIQGDRLIVKYNGNEVAANELKLRNAEAKFKGTSVSNFIKNNVIIKNNMIEIAIGDNTTKTTISYYPLFLSSAMMAEAEASNQSNDGKNEHAEHGSYYQRLEVQIAPEGPAADESTAGTDAEANETVIKVWFNPYVAKSKFEKVEEGKTPAVPEVSIMRTSRQITAYSYDAMQNTAKGKVGKDPHTLRLERDISLKEAFETDSTVTNGETNTENLSFPESSYVILDLNGKTLAGKGAERVITCKNSNSETNPKTVLEIYGKKEEGGTSGTATYGTIEGGGISMEGVAKGLLKNVIISYIKVPDESDDRSNVSIEVVQGVTLDGCMIERYEYENK